jgi:integrase
MTNDLVRFYGYKNIPFDKPRYKRVETLPFIPLESEVQNLISGVGKKTTTFLQLIKETGCRPGEAWNLRWIDIDSEKSTVSIRPEKTVTQES